MGGLILIHRAQWKHSLMVTSSPAVAMAGPGHKHDTSGVFHRWSSHHRSKGSQIRGELGLWYCSMAAAKGCETNHRLHTAEEVEASSSGLWQALLCSVLPLRYRGFLRKCVMLWKCPDALHVQQKSTAVPQSSSYTVKLARGPRWVSESIKVS